MTYRYIRHRAPILVFRLCTPRKTVLPIPFVFGVHLTVIVLERLECLCTDAIIPPIVHRLSGFSAYNNNNIITISWCVRFVTPLGYWAELCYIIVSKTSKIIWETVIRTSAYISMYTGILHYKHSDRGRWAAGILVITLYYSYGSKTANKNSKIIFKITLYYHLLSCCCCWLVWFQTKVEY